MTFLSSEQLIGLTEGSSQYPVDEAGLALDYGTAGFRTKAEHLDGIAFRTGVLVALRSLSKEGYVIGLMLTASHNASCDNGVKVVEKDGEMLNPEWEKLAVSAVRAHDLSQFINNVIQKENIELGGHKGRVLLGWDTRQSSPRLAQIASEGVVAMGAQCCHLGLVTTPQLHYLVKQQNSRDPYGPVLPISLYYSQYTSALVNMSRSWPPASPRPVVHVDCANGIGAAGLLPFVDGVKDHLEVLLHNRGLGQDANLLNLNCGADHVKVKGTFPHLTEGHTVRVGERWASFDGDADRIIYFFSTPGDNFHILDGDRLATLYAGYLVDCLRECPDHNLTLGLVQTAYANAASTQYIKDKLGVPVFCVPTGVKHLHHKAQEFDIGVYFEANGHGTILFSDKAIIYMRCLDEINPLSQITRLVNDATGDAISDLFLTEHILAMRGWSLSQWSSQYTDLPSRQGKVMVKDRTVVTTTDAERRASTPEGLQDRIDILVKASGLQSRAFVRPSGTEDVVRVYAEASTQEGANKLATDVAALLHKMADGVGVPPTF